LFKARLDSHRGSVKKIYRFFDFSKNEEFL
jgi:hypothetical protein